MSFLRKLKSFALLTFICTFLISASLTSCTQTGQAEEDSTEHPEGEAAKSEHPEGDAEKSEHPEGKEEHPTNKPDSTKVEEQ